MSLLSLITILTIFKFISTQVIPLDSLTAKSWPFFAKFISSGAISNLNTLKLNKLQTVKEKDSISPHDQYAKWTKLNRKLDDLNQSITLQESQISTDLEKFSKFVKFVHFVLFTILIWGLRLWYRSNVLLELDIRIPVVSTFVQFGSSSKTITNSSVGIDALKTTLTIGPWLYFLNNFLSNLSFVYEKLSQTAVKPIKPTS